MPEPRGLVVDWGGVLTGDVRVAVRSWAESDGVPVDTYVAVIRDWMGEPYGAAARLNPIHALERGEMTAPDFESRLATALTERTGHPFAADGLLERLFENFEHAPDMSALVRVPVVRVCAPGCCRTPGATTTRAMAGRTCSTSSSSPARSACASRSRRSSSTSSS